MPNTYMTIEQAATHLGVSPRTVRTYIQQELLGTHKEKGSARKWLKPEEVEELRLDRLESPRAGLHIRKELLQLRSQHRRMRAELDAVLRILDTGNESLKITPKYAQGLYGAVVGQLQRPSWSIDEITSWLTIFLRIDEDDFQRVREATDDTKPWVPFLRLAMAMTRFVATHPAYSTDVGLQSLHRELGEARRRLRISSMCYMDLHAYDLDKAIRRAQLTDSPMSVRDVISRVVRGN